MQLYPLQSESVCYLSHFTLHIKGSQPSTGFSLPQFPVTNAPPQNEPEGKREPVRRT